MDQRVLEQTANFQTLKSIKAYGTLKLFKATQKQHGEVTAMLMVPAQAWLIFRPDGTSSLTIFCHTAVLSKVSSSSFPQLCHVISRCSTVCLMLPLCLMFAVWESTVVRGVQPEEQEDSRIRGLRTRVGDFSGEASALDAVRAR